MYVFGTISDIVPLIDENRIIAKLGLKLLAQTRNIGLKQLIAETKYKQVDTSAISFGIAPRINACGRMGYEEEALKLFLTNNIEEARHITMNLNKYNLLRQQKEKEIFDNALTKIDTKNINKVSSIVLEGENWHSGVIGIVASKITEKYCKPTILMCAEGNETKGSGRSVQGFDLHKALEKLNIYLNRFGGHEMAVGLSLDRKNFKVFKEEFEKLAKEQKVDELVSVINIDDVITSKDVTKETIEQIKTLEPFGEQNKVPIFLYKNLKIDSIRAISEGKHLKLGLKDDNFYLNCIGFNLGYLADEYLLGDKVDIVGMMENNTYNGTTTIQFNIKDIMKSI